MTTSAQLLLVFLFKRTKRTIMNYMLIIIVQFLFFFCHLVEKMMMNMQFIIIFGKKKLAFGKNKRTTMSYMFIIIFFFVLVHLSHCKGNDNKRATCHYRFSFSVCLYHCRKDDDDHATCIISPASITCYLAFSRYDKILVRWVIPIVGEIVLPNIPQLGSTFII